VLVHELAHALVAQREGVGVNSITLFVLGGAAHIAHEPPSAGSDLRIVVAGPLASISLGFFYALASHSTGGTPAIQETCHYLSGMNFMLAGFNLIPGFPLDGGRIIRAFLWKFTGSLQKATHLAASSGYLVAAAFVSVGIAFIIFEKLYDGSWSAMIGLFMAYIAYDNKRRPKNKESNPGR
jgi:Zn-dependent protease